MKTLVCSPSLKVAVSGSTPLADTDWPMPTASDELKASTIMAWGMWRSRPCLAGSENITPDDVNTNMLERSQRPGLASRARSMGLAKASPTMAVVLPLRSSMVSNSSSMSRWRLSRVTTQPPPERAMSWVMQPVPCMSGQAGTLTMPGPWTSSRVTS